MDGWLKPMNDCHQGECRLVSSGKPEVSGELLQPNDINLRHVLNVSFFLINELNPNHYLFLKRVN